MLEGFVAPTGDGWWPGVPDLARCEIETPDVGVDFSREVWVPLDLPCRVQVPGVTGKVPGRVRLWASEWPEVQRGERIADLRLTLETGHSQPAEIAAFAGKTIPVQFVPAAYVPMDLLTGNPKLLVPQWTRLRLEATSELPWHLPDGTVATVVSASSERRIRGASWQLVEVELSEQVVWDTARYTPWAPQNRTSSALLGCALGTRPDPDGPNIVALIPLDEPRPGGPTDPSFLFPGAKVLAEPL